MIKAIFILSIAILLIMFAGCDVSKPQDSMLSAESPNNIYETVTTNIEGKSDMTNCKLIINSKDITCGNYVMIDPNNQNTVLPLSVVINELGGSVTWKNEKTVEIRFKENAFELNIEKDDYGIPIPPGTSNAVRQVIGKEIYFDGNSIQKLLANMAGARITVDYDSSIIYIVSQ